MSLAFSYPRAAGFRWSGDRAVVEAALGKVCGEGVVVEEAAVAGVAVGVGLTPADVGAEGEAGWEGEGAGGARGLGRHGLFRFFFRFVFGKVNDSSGRSDEVRERGVDGSCMLLFWRLKGRWSADSCLRKRRECSVRSMEREAVTG
jgi:hypothetical protein